jgi:hypothetical protein
MQISKLWLTFLKYFYFLQISRKQKAVFKSIRLGTWQPKIQILAPRAASVPFGTDLTMLSKLQHLPWENEDNLHI